MAQATFEQWEMAYIEDINTLRVLINGEHLLNLTNSNMESFLETFQTMESENLFLELSVQPMIQQVVGDDTFDEETFEYIEGNFNYKLSDADLTEFHAGDDEELDLEFDSMRDAMNLYNSVLEHPAAEYIL